MDFQMLQSITILTPKKVPSIYQDPQKALTPCQNQLVDVEGTGYRMERSTAFMVIYRILETKMETIV